MLSKCLFVMLLSLSVNAVAKNTTESVKTANYTDVGRVEWHLPNSHKYYLAVPHFSAGARVKCGDEKLQSCEIEVQPRDLLMSDDERRQEFIKKNTDDARISVEKEVVIQTYATAPTVFYTVLTDPRAGESFKLATRGYVVNGVAVIYFEFLNNEQSDIKPFLDVVQKAVVLDSKEVWAWRFKDYIAACQTNYPEQFITSRAAFDASVFAQVNIDDYFKKAFPSMGGQKARAKFISEAADGWVKMFNGYTQAEQKETCSQLVESINRTQSYLKVIS